MSGLFPTHALCRPRRLVTQRMSHNPPSGSCRPPGPASDALSAMFDEWVVGGLEMPHTAADHSAPASTPPRIGAALPQSRGPAPPLAISDPALLPLAQRPSGKSTSSSSSGASGTQAPTHAPTSRPHGKAARGAATSGGGGGSSKRGHYVGNVPLTAGGKVRVTGARPKTTRT